MKRGVREFWVPSSLIVMQAAFAFVVVFHGWRSMPAANANPAGDVFRQKVQIRKWQYIVIHHSATPSGNAESFDRFHRYERRWSGGLGYHFVIGNGHGSVDGQIEIGPRWEAQEDGAHAGIREYNEYGIGICLVGDFTNGRPTEEQMASLLALCRDLMKRCNIGVDHVYGHRELPGATTECPGREFSMDELRGLLKQG